MATATWALTKSTRSSASPFVTSATSRSGKNRSSALSCVGLELAQQSFVLGGQLEAEWQEASRRCASAAPVLRRHLHVMIGDLDKGLGQADGEGVWLSIGPLMVVAQDGLERFGLHQNCQRRDRSPPAMPLSTRTEAARRMCSLLLLDGARREGADWGRSASRRTGPASPAWSSVGLGVQHGGSAADQAHCSLLAGALKEIRVSFVFGQASIFSLAAFHSWGVRRTRSRGFGHKVLFSSQSENLLHDVIIDGVRRRCRRRRTSWRKRPDQSRASCPRR